MTEDAVIQKERIYQLERTPATVISQLMPRKSRIERCPYCDSTEHSKKQCLLLQQAIQVGLVRLNQYQRLIDVTTGKEYSSMYGRGGIQLLMSKS